MHNVPEVFALSQKDYLFLVVALLVVAGAYTWNRRRLLATGRTWKKLAERLKGKFRHKNGGWILEPYYEVECTLSEVPLRLSYFIRSSGKRRTYWTRVTTACDPDLEFEIYQEGLFQKIGKGLGFQDVQLEDAAYDAAFIIKSNVPGDMQRLCNEEFRRLHLQQEKTAVSAEDGLIRVTRRGLVDDFDESLQLVELAAVAARSVRAPRS